MRSIRIGYNKDFLKKNNNLKLTIKFLIQDESRKIKKEAFSKSIELTNPLIYFNDDITINNIKLSDSLIIQYYNINGQKKEDSHLVIKLKKLKKDIEEDAVWTIGSNSFIILFYELMTISKKGNKYISNQFFNSVNILDNKNTKYDFTLGDSNGESSSMGGEPTCSTGSTGKIERNSKQSNSEIINNNNEKIEINQFNPISINDEENTSLNTPKQNQTTFVMSLRT